MHLAYLNMNGLTLLEECESEDEARQTATKLLERATNSYPNVDWRAKIYSIERKEEISLDEKSFSCIDPEGPIQHYTDATTQQAA